MFLAVKSLTPVSPGVLSFSRTQYSGDEDGGAVTLSVSRTNGTSGAVGCSYTTVQGSAVSGVNYTHATGTLAWGNAESAAKTFTVTPIDDGVVAADKQFTVELSTPTGGAVIGRSVATVTVVNTDAPVSGSLQFSSSAYSVSEDGGSLQVSVSRNGGTDGAVAVDLGITGGTAVSGTDYTAPAGGTTWRLSWNNGEAGSKSLLFTIIDRDGVKQGDKTINLVISSVDGSTLGSPSAATITIIDQDVSSGAGELRFQSSEYTVSEDDGSVTVAVERAAGSSGTASATVDVISGTAVEGTDYSLPGEAVRLEANAGTLTNIGTESRTGASDGIVTFQNADGMTSTVAVTYSGEPGTATITFRVYDESDGASTYPVTVGGASIGSFTSNINDNDFHDFSFTGVAIATGDVISTTFKSNGGERGRLDYIDVLLEDSNVVEWTSGDGSPKSVVYTIIDRDGEAQGNKTLQLSLGNVTGASTGSPASTMVTIVDQDLVSAGAVQFLSGTSTVGESAVTHTVTVSRSGGTAGTASAAVAIVGGTAVSGTDYTATTPQLLEWADAEGGNKTATYTIIDRDGVKQGDKTISLSITAGGADLGSPSTHTITIIDEDADAAAAGQWPTQGATPKLPILPELRGHGYDCVGGSGRGGSGTPVIRTVTNTNTSGSGSLQAAIDAHNSASAPSIIVFNTSGIIKLSGKQVTSKPYLTIAGETAPAPGVALMVPNLWIQSSDTLISHVRFFLSDSSEYGSYDNRDSLHLGTSGYAISRVVLANCSFSWGLDETFQPYYRIVGLTAWRCMFYEGLNLNWHPEGSHGCLIIFDGGDSTCRFTLTQSLLAVPGALGRMPLVGTGSTVICNNLMYGAGSSYAMLFKSGNNGSPSEIVNNWFYRYAPNQGPFISSNSGRTLQITGNVMAGYNPKQGVSGQSGTTGIRAPGMVLASASDARDLILKTAGARPKFEATEFTNPLDGKGHQKRIKDVIRYALANPGAWYTSAPSTEDKNIGHHRDWMERSNVAKWGDPIDSSGSSLKGWRYTRVPGGYPSLPVNTASFSLPSDWNTTPVTDPYTGQANPGYKKIELYLHSLQRAVSN